MAIPEATWARDLYNYDQETGEFTWRNPPPKARGRAKVGAPAGTVDTRKDGLVLRLGGKLHQASRIAWLYAYGEWPERQVHFKDASLPLPTKNRLDNLHLTGTTEDVTAEKLREVLRYEPETGDFFWLVKKRGVVAGAPAGTIKPINGKLWRYVRFEGVEYPGSRLAWLMYHGEWPRRRLEFCDGDRSNTRIGNLVEGRFSHGTRQDDPLTQEERLSRRSAVYRRKDLQRSYGLTESDYAAMMEAQGSVCASCGEPETGMLMGKVRQLAVDHDHKTGAIRGLLCVRCNASQGVLDDNLEKHLMVSTHLSRHATQEDLLAAKRQLDILSATIHQRLADLLIPLPREATS